MLVSMLLILSYLIWIGYTFQDIGAFQNRALSMGLTAILIYSAFGVYRCSGNTDFSLVRGIALFYAIVLALLATLSAIASFGLMYGVIFVFVMIGLWCKIEGHI